jgi:hypothetical protein
MDEMTPADFYGLLQASDGVSRVGQLLAPHASVAASTFTMVWGEVADCVFRQNGRTFCEPNNRALAVEAAASLIRQTDAIGAPTQDRSSFMQTRPALEMAVETKRGLDQMRDSKGRVLTALRARLQEGRLIAADFGTFPSGEIKRLLQENKPTRNACAEEGIGHAQAQPPPVTRRSADRAEEEARRRIRNYTLQGLGQPSASLCTPEGHKYLINALDHYFGKRALYERAAAELGPESAREDRARWQTADDSRIERLTREAYGRGHFKPDELRPDLRATVAQLVRGERVSGRACGG